MGLLNNKYNWVFIAYVVVNFSKGAKCMSIKLDAKLTETALSAAEVLGLPICGVDIIKQKDKLFVIEVNGIPAWKGLQSINKENISDIIVDSFLNTPSYNTNLSVKPISQ